MSANYVEVNFRTDVDSGEILAMLEGCENLGCWEEGGVVHIFWPEHLWTPAALDDLKKALAVFNLDTDGLTISAVPDKDWNATWAASLTPLRLGRHFRVRQSWHPPDDAFKGFDLVIDPKRAFGTGHHITTQLVVEWLEKNIRGGEKVLDVGTGSGILSMAAIRLGAESALGIDNDPVAIECAREYARLNGFGDELELRVGSFDEYADKRFDVVVANIDGKTLPLLCPVLPLWLKTGGVACFSGLQTPDLQEVSMALRHAGFVIREQVAREDWLALDLILRHSG